MSIATQISRLQIAKAGIKTSLEAKGVTVPTETLLGGYPALVDSITSGGDCVEAKGIKVTSKAKDQIQIGDIVYTVFVDTMSYVSDIYANSGTTVLSSNVNTAVFSPDGSKLILGGQFTGRAKLYTVSGTTITYVSDIYADNSSTALSHNVNSVVFSLDGSKLILGGVFSGKAKLYTISGTTITYISDIYADNSSTALDNSVIAITLSPDGTKLIIGGIFTGKAKLYTISGTTITYISDIYADNSATPLSTNGVNTAVFSPDGGRIVLGGGMTGRAKLYTVSGTTITYRHNIYANSGTTALSAAVYTAIFSLDGSKLILGGQFAGRAKIYTVSGTSATYVSDIYADNNSTVLDDTVKTVVLSIDGGRMVLGGYFTGYAKLYTISGTTITYIDDFYNDNSSTVLSIDSLSIIFSPDNEKLVIGGSGSVKAKLYIRDKESFIEKPIVPDCWIGYSLNNAEIDEVIQAILISKVNVDTSDATAVASDIALAKTAYVNGTKLTGTNTATITNPVNSFTINGDYASSTYYTAAGSGYAIMANGNVVIFIQGGTSTSYEHIYFNANSLTGATAGVGFGISDWDTSDPAQVVYACTLTGVSAGRAITVALDNVNSTDDYVRANITVANA